MLLTAPTFAVTTFTGQAWVIDGDSLRITLSNFTKKEVRLFGIDAPEMSTKKGRFAKRVMIHLLKTGGRTITCTQVDRDKYKRYVSICKNAHGDLAENMLKNGQAVIYQYFIKNAPIELQKKYLKAASIGQIYLKQHK